METTLPVYQTLGWLLLTLAANLALAEDETEASADELFRAALVQSNQGNSDAAVKLLDRTIKAAPEKAAPYRWRGREQFRLGKIDASLADFDRFVELAPRAEPSLWERGITQYYAGKFAEGAKQFELYQTYHDADVENATWRYLCVAKTDGVARARETLLPIIGDTRVPMRQIYDLYRGKLTPADVLTAAAAGKPTEEQLNRQLFYAHLYIGLYYEAAGNAALAKKHITIAANEHMIPHYMGDVARIHAARLRLPK